MFTITPITVTTDSDLIWTFDIGSKVFEWECLHCFDSATFFLFTQAVDHGNDHEQEAISHTGKIDGCIPVGREEWEVYFSL